MKLHGQDRKDIDNDTARAVQSFTESEYPSKSKSITIQPPSPDSITTQISDTMGSDIIDDYHEELRKSQSIVKIVEMLHDNQIWNESNSTIRVYLLLNNYPYSILFEILKLKQIMKSLPSNHNPQWLKVF